MKWNITKKTNFYYFEEYHTECDFISKFCTLLKPFQLNYVNANKCFMNNSIYINSELPWWAIQNGRFSFIGFLQKIKEKLRKGTMQNDHEIANYKQYDRQTSLKNKKQIASLAMTEGKNAFMTC